MLTVIDSSGTRYDGLTGELSMPIRGNWVARVELSEQHPAVGPLTLEIQRDDGAGVDTFIGTQRYGGDWQGRSELVVVGGAGALLTELPAKHYAPKAKTIDGRVVLEDIAREAGETLDPSSTVGGRLLQWTRAAAAPTRSLALLADRFGHEWRVLASGALWMGAETWPTASPDDLGYLAQERPEARAIELRPNQATLRPGMMIDARQVTRVVYRIGGPGLSATAYYGLSDRRELADSVVGLLPDPTYTHTYGASVVSQVGNLLEVLVDDDRIATLRRIPLRTGLGGSRTVLRAGDRVRVAFENGAPDGAYALGVDALAADGTNHGIARAGDAVSCGFFKVNGAGKLVRTNAGDPDGVEFTGTITSASSEVFLRWP